MNAHKTIPFRDALFLLKEGNNKYSVSGSATGDFSPLIRESTYTNGQNPYAVIITCSDSRVIPEVIFSASIGDLFVIRVAGNVIDSASLASVEYALDHLGCKLVLVLGHTSCGAVTSAMSGKQHGYVSYITDIISNVIGENNDGRACSLINARNSAMTLKNALSDEKYADVDFLSALYDTKSGIVEF